MLGALGRIAAIGIAAAGMAAGLTGGAVSAREVVPAERRILPWDAQFAACQDPEVLATIARKFADREAEYWKTGLTILGFERLQRTAFRPAGLDLIPRRYCSGVVLVSDGRKRRVDYSVREDLGPIGATWDVDWCIQGLDRLWFYAPHCRMARP